MELGGKVNQGPGNKSLKSLFGMQVWRRGTVAFGVVQCLSFLGAEVVFPCITRWSCLLF